MNIGRSVRDFLLTFVLVLVVSSTVSYLYSLIVHSAGVVDWEGSLRLAIIFGIALPAIREIERRQKTKA